MSDLDQPTPILRISTRQFAALQFGVIAVGIALGWLMTLLVPGSWPVAFRVGLAVLPPIMALIAWAVLFMGEKYIEVEPSASVDPDPHRTMLRQKVLMGGFFLFLAFGVAGLPELLGASLHSVILYTFCAIMLFRGVRGLADARVNPRASGDERDDALELQARRMGAQITTMVVLTIVAIDSFEWLELNVTHAVLFVLMTHYAAREFCFIWYEWRSDR